MIYVLIGIAFFFVAIGFILTENNAKYLLAGYNTMNKKDKKKVNIKAFIPYFRNFHIFLGATFLIFGAALTWLIGGNAAGIFMAVYPILAYIYFIATSLKYSQGLNSGWNKTGIVLLSVTLLFVIGLLGFGYKENKLSINSNVIELKGIYGEILIQSEIQSIELVNKLPEIRSRKNGFAFGTINKGYFKTKNGEVVKLILNSDIKPVILFTKTNGDKIYYSAKDKTGEELLSEMRRNFPGIIHR